MISFDNTEIAFSNKTNRELWKAKFLFKLYATPQIVGFNKGLLSISQFLHFPIDWLIKSTIYKLFVGGESIRDCQPYVKKLFLQNVKSILQYSVDNIQNSKRFEEFYLELKSLIQNSTNNPEIAFNVFKPSNLISKSTLSKASQGDALSNIELQELEIFKVWIDNLCSDSHKAQKPILIDAEESWCQPVVDELLFEMMLKYNTTQCFVYSTFQMYRTDRLQYLFNCHKQAKDNGFILGVKLVRGAYMEKERIRSEKMGYTSPIHESKADTDRDFNEALKFIIYNLETTSLICGTHNEDSINYLTCLMDSYGIEPSDSRIYISQLYGMSDNISFNLSLNDYNVAKCIPYGPPKHVLSYLIRRAEENSAVQGQTGRESKMITLEIKRRRAARRAKTLN